MPKQSSARHFLPPLIMISLGLWHFLRHGVDVMTVFMMSLGSFALYMALFNHSLLERVLAGITKIWYPIGQFIALTLFTIMFFIIFTPVGIVLRLLKKDILGKNIDLNQSSYWIERSIKEEHSYTQQF